MTGFWCNASTSGPFICPVAVSRHVAKHPRDASSELVGACASAQRVQRPAARPALLEGAEAGEVVRELQLPPPEVRDRA
eukprot:2802973-Lingulodinium_polyedra.AAC.1